MRKAGRTHLHDATPMTLGQEFAGYAVNVRRAGDRAPRAGGAARRGAARRDGDRHRHQHAARLRRPRRRPARRHHRPAAARGADRIASQQSLGDFVALSGALRGLAVELGKIANDLRLLSSGPHTGLDEIELPALQPGSSIMPGKVNPVVAEMLNMACFHVIGHDVAITMAGEAGQLELNVMLPYVAFALLDSLDVLAHAVATFDTKTVRLDAGASRALRLLRRAHGRRRDGPERRARFPGRGGGRAGSHPQRTDGGRGRWPSGAPDHGSCSVTVVPLPGVDVISS